MERPFLDLRDAALPSPVIHAMPYAPYPSELLELILAPVILKILGEDGGTDLSGALASLRERFNLPEGFFDDVAFDAVIPINDTSRASTHAATTSCSEAEALRRLEARWFDKQGEFSPMLDDEPMKSWKHAKAELMGVETTLSHRGGPVTAAGGSWMGFLGAKVDWLVSLLERDDLLSAAAGITAIACGEYVSFGDGGVTLRRDFVVSGGFNLSGEDGGSGGGGGGDGGGSGHRQLLPPPHEWRDRKDGSLLHHASSAKAVRLLIDLIPGFGEPSLSLLNITTAVTTENNGTPQQNGSSSSSSSSSSSTGRLGRLGKSVVEHRQREGYTALHLATTAAQAKVLVARGAKLDSVTNGGLTCLFSCRSAPLARELLALGANPMAKSLYRHTALHLAASHGLWEVCWFLLEAGSDACAQGLDGHTPLTLVKRILEGVPRTMGRAAGAATGASSGEPQQAAGGDETSSLSASTSLRSMPANRSDLVKTAEILGLWVQLLKAPASKAVAAVEKFDPVGDEEKEGAANGGGGARSGRRTSPAPPRLHQHMFRTLEAKVAAATHARLAQDPAAALTESTGLPLELTDLILTRYVSIFSGARDLMDDDDDDDNAATGCVALEAAAGGGEMSVLSGGALRATEASVSIGASARSSPRQICSNAALLNRRLGRGGVAMALPRRERWRLRRGVAYEPPVGDNATTSKAAWKLSLSEISRNPIALAVAVASVAIAITLCKFSSV